MDVLFQQRTNLIKNKDDKKQSNKDFNFNILHDWSKAITIPYKVDNYLNVNFIFLINDQEIDISSFLSTK